MIRRHSLVVGGTKGLGRQFVRYFLKKGYSVSVVSRTSPGVGAEKKARYCTADVANPAEFIRAMKKSLDESGPFDNVVLSQRFRGEDTWNGELSVTLGGTRTAIEFVKDHFDSKGAKSIVVISSVAGRFFIDDQPVSYHVSKAALEHMVRYYAVALGPSGIRVNSVVPCAFVKDESRGFYSNNKEIQSFYRRVIPLGRMVTTEDIAIVTGFLTAPECYLTGQSIVMDGGISLLWPEAAAKRFENPFVKAKRS